MSQIAQGSKRRSRQKVSGTVTKAETSKVVRFSGANYRSFTLLKEAYARKHRLKGRQDTYDAFLSQLLSVAEALLLGSELYRVGDRTFADLAEARGAAILEAVRAGVPPKANAVEILVRIGTDAGLVKE